MMMHNIFKITNPSLINNSNSLNIYTRYTKPSIKVPSTSTYLLSILRFEWCRFKHHHGVSSCEEDGRGWNKGGNNVFI